MEDVEVQIWLEKKSRWQELVKPWLNFCKHEPLFAAVTHVLDEGNNRDSLTAMLRDMLAMDNTVLLVAWDSVKQQVAGFLFATTSYAEKTSEDTGKTLYGFEKYSFDSDTLQQLLVMTEFLNDLFNKGDVFRRCRVDSVMSIQVTTVCPEYKRRGLADRMTKKFLEVVKERSVSVVVSESTSAFTQHNKIHKFDFEKIVQVDYSSHYAMFMAMPEDIRNTHKNAAFLIRKL